MHVFVRKLSAARGHLFRQAKIILFYQALTRTEIEKRLVNPVS